MLDAKDQLAMFGLAEALAKLGHLQDADDVYKKCIEIDAYSKIADLAQAERRKIATGSQQKNRGRISFAPYVA